jgi:hypothetical protein
LQAGGGGCAIIALSQASALTPDFLIHSYAQTRLRIRLLPERGSEDHDAPNLRRLPSNEGEGIGGPTEQRTLGEMPGGRSNMPSLIVRAFAIGLIAAAVSGPATAQIADIVLDNGKIITVDERFTIAETIAIRGQRVIAVGPTSELAKFKGPQTQVIDLNGRTVIPGLIDNHAHWIRAAEHNELRWDGVTTRARALQLLENRVRDASASEWIAVLGGWSEEQFTDEARGFSLDELDRIAPNNPVVLQSF